MKILSLLLFSLIQLGHSQVIPQLFVGDAQESSSIDWKFIESSHFKVIYPEGVRDEAFRVMNSLEFNYLNVKEDLRIDTQKISIILRVGPVVSNGFVTLAPRRSEWFITPFLDTQLGAGQWTDLLSIHEYRHVAQMDALNTGFGEMLSYFMGETGRAFAMIWSTPAWFMEGDAVFTETSLTNYGRGRLPEFESQFKALLLENEKFSFSKMLLRSYETFIPNHYVLGFYLVSYIREKYSDRVISKILEDNGDYSYNPFAFYNAVEEYTRKDIDEIYSSMRSYFFEKWDGVANRTRLSDKSDLLGAEESFNRYRYVWPYNGGVVAYKDGFDSPGEIVFIKDKKQEHIKTTGRITASGIKKCGDSLVWSEYTPHYRWGNQSYSEIILFDLATETKKYLTSSTRYFSANLSSDCSQIVAIEIDRELKKSLVVLNSSNGKLIKKILLPKNSLYTHFDFLENSSGVVAVNKEQVSGKVSLVTFDFSSRKERVLVAPSYHVIANPEVFQNKVYYRSSFNGVDNIYVYNLKDSSTQQIVSSKFGAYNPSTDGKYLYYSEYHSNGHRPVKALLGSFSTRARENEHSIGWDNKIAKRINKAPPKNVLHEAIHKEYKEKEYGPWSAPFNPHSWLLLPTPTAVNLQLVSSNIMQDLYFTAGYSYSNTERTGGAFAGFSFARYYPIFDFSISEKRRGRQTPGTKEDDEVNQNWKEVELDSGMLLLANHSSGAYDRLFSLRPFYGMVKVEDRPYALANDINNQSLQYYGVELSYRVSKRMSLRDYFPRWGFKTDLVGKKGYVGEDNTIGSDLFSSDSYLFFPGILNHHSFYLSGSYSYQKDEGYIFSPEFNFSRGYDNFYFDHISKYSANYTLPLINSDWGLGDYVYFRRFGINFFYDYADVSLDSGLNRKFKSYGAELLVNSSFFLNMNLTIDWGIRYSHRDFYGDDEVSIFLESVF